MPKLKAAWLQSIIIVIVMVYVAKFVSLISVEAKQCSGVTVPTVIFLILLCAIVPSIEMLIAFNSVSAYSQKGSIITPNV